MPEWNLCGIVIGLYSSSSKVSFFLSFPLSQSLLVLLLIIPATCQLIVCRMMIININVLIGSNNITLCWDVNVLIPFLIAKFYPPIQFSLKGLFLKVIFVIFFYIFIIIIDVLMVHVKITIKIVLSLFLQFALLACRVIHAFFPILVSLYYFIRDLLIID